jgi:hypothetical protein
MRTVIAGKSRNTILFSAQQFKSAVDMSLIENTGTHTIAELGLSELSTAPTAPITPTNIVVVCSDDKYCSVSSLQIY